MPPRPRRSPPPPSGTGSPRAESWVQGAAGSLYDADNLPYGVVRTPGSAPRVGVRIGDLVLDLAAAAEATRPDLVPLLATGSLNPLMAAGPTTWADVRAWATGLVSDPRHRGVVTLLPVEAVTPQLPFEVADYVDYYASLHHATNVGRIFRPDGEALAPNWRHLPVAYHGRAGSVVVSGTPVRRPLGQRRGPGERLPTFGPSQRLDLEAELGFVVGRTVPLGTRVAASELAQTVFGVTGLNDWSARDIQAWESVPLGPNLGKSFATSVSAWVTPLAALQHARVAMPEQDPEVLPYLREEERWGLDIDVEVEVAGEVVARPPYASMYWSPGQLLAHLTVGGASLRVGDLFGSGTISGPERHQRGSLLELCWGGREPWSAGGRERTFLEDGDEVVLRYTAPGARGRTGPGRIGPRRIGPCRIGLGEVRATIEPARLGPHPA